MTEWLSFNFTELTFHLSVERMLADNIIKRFGISSSLHAHPPYCISQRKLSDEVNGKGVRFTEADTVAGKKQRGLVKEASIAVTSKYAREKTQINQDGNRNRNAEEDEANNDSDERSAVECASISPPQEIQAGFEGDTEDSDNCGRGGTCYGHSVAHKSRSAPDGVRAKRRRMKRKAASAELDVESKDQLKNGLMKSRDYLEVPRRSIDRNAPGVDFCETDSTDIDTDASYSHASKNSHNARPKIGKTDDEREEKSKEQSM